MTRNATTCEAASGLAGRRPGLSLIEVMLGMAIMLLSLVAIGSLVDVGSDRGFEARLHVRGTRLAQAKMAEVEAGALPLDSPSNGTFDNDPDWAFTVDPSPQATPNLYLVTVKVTRDLRGTPFEITLSQMLFDPTKMGSSATATKASDSTGTSGTGTSGTGTSGTGTSGTGTSGGATK